MIKNLGINHLKLHEISTITILNLKILSILTFLIFMSNGINLFSQDKEPAEKSNSEKLVFFDAGYGTRNLSFGLGFRYSFIGASLSLAGIAASTPHATYHGIVYPKTFTTETYPSTTVSFDLIGYYDWNDFSFFGMLGYYTQADSLFDKSLEDNTFGYYFFHQPLASLNKSGISLGLGAQYYLTEAIEVGIGYHTKKGAFLQIGYYWF